MRRTGLKCGLKLMTTCAMLALVMAPRASAQQVTEQRLQELIREAAARAGVTSLPAASGAGGNAAQAVSGQVTQDARAVVHLTLDDAIKFALDRNLDIAVQRLNPQTFDFSLSNLQALYRPILTSNILQQSATTGSTSTTNGQAAGFATDVTTTTYNAGMTQSFPKFGGNVVVSLNNLRTNTSSPTATMNPFYQPVWSAQFTQPLMRNFRIDTNRENLVITKLNQDISEDQLQATIINTLSNVRNAYWNYVFAVQSVDVTKRSVTLAEQLVKDNQTRVEVGTMAPIDVIQAQSQAATQRQNLAQAEGARRTAELALKRLIVAGTQDANWNSDIDPIDRPDFVPQTVDVTAAVRKALETRTDLAQVRKNLQVNDVTMKFLKNQTLPQVDLVALYRRQGLGGTVYTRSGSGITGAITSTTPGGFTDALSSLFSSKYPVWNIGVNVSYPLGTSAQDATVARAQLQTHQVEAQLHQIELQVATDVTNAAVSVQSNTERVQAAQAAREFAQKQLEAEQSKFDVGMSTNYLVIQSQRDLATAQNNELSAVLAYRQSVVELELLQQTSLSSANITIVGK
jgi:outer membrane protein